MHKGLIIIILLFFALSSCNNSSRKSADEDFEIPDSVKNYQGELEVSKETMSDIVENISSPIEMAALMLDLDIPFSKDYITTTDNLANYTTSYQKAITLGIFGADLGYLNMYNKTSVVLDYITAIKDLADGIKVGQFFDFTTLKRLVTNKTNLDSLMLISQQNFNKMDEYLRENNRSNLSILIITGTWIEGMNLITEVIKEHPHEKINEFIGDQKTIVSIVHGLLDNYKKDPFFQDLANDFQELKTIYEEVSITTEVTDPKPVEVDGVLVFESAEVSIVNISDETISKINKKVSEIRKKIISV